LNTRAHQVPRAVLARENESAFELRSHLDPELRDRPTENATRHKALRLLVTMAEVTPVLGLVLTGRLEATGVDLLEQLIKALKAFVIAESRLDLAGH
jgi:hypothetical protein